jgi:hypothetical protein
MYSTLPSEDGQLIYSKHVEDIYWNKFKKKVHLVGSYYGKIKTKIHRTVILSAVLYGCEVWSLTSRQECRLSVVRNILGPKFEAVAEERSLLSCTLYQILFG